MEDIMKQCSLDHFIESLRPWLDNNYIRNVVIDKKGHVTFTFMDGIKDTYQITGCDKAYVKKVCKEISMRGIPVKEL